MNQYRDNNNEPIEKDYDILEPKILEPKFTKNPSNKNIGIFIYLLLFLLISLGIYAIIQHKFVKNTYINITDMSYSDDVSRDMQRYAKNLSRFFITYNGYDTDFNSLPDQNALTDADYQKELQIINEQYEYEINLLTTEYGLEDNATIVMEGQAALESQSEETISATEEGIYEETAYESARTAIIEKYEQK